MNCPSCGKVIEGFIHPERKIIMCDDCIMEDMEDMEDQFDDQWEREFPKE